VTAEAGEPERDLPAEPAAAPAAAPVMTATFPSKRSGANIETPGPACQLMSNSPIGTPAFVRLVVMEDVLCDRDAVHVVRHPTSAHRSEVTHW
jgi:hypothetical protein